MSSSTQYADTIVIANKIITMQNTGRNHARAVIVNGGRIVDLVDQTDIQRFQGPDTKVINLGSKTLMPGFVDVHAHAEVVCRTVFGTVDCRAPECSTIADVLTALKNADKGDGSWIIGQGNLFFDRKLAEGRLPTREELDSVSTNSPVALRAGGHITVLNSKALEIAGINRDYRPPEHSVTGLPDVVRDENGDPTGVVKEMDTLLPFPEINRDELKVALKEGLANYFTRFGVTTIGEISETVEGIESMGELAEEDELPVSMRIYLWAPGTLMLDQACNWKEHIYLGCDEKDVRIHGLKLFSDGGFSAKSAAVNCPYIGSSSCGSIAFPKYFLRRALQKTRDSDLQLAIHANGDRAQEWLCEMITEFGGAPEGRIRTRIEHAGNLLPSESTRQWWSRAGIIPVPQPVFLYTFGEYFTDYLGDYGSRGRFPFRSLLDQGWRLSGSSDVWIGSEREATNPFFSIWNCLKRESYSGNTLDAHEAITIEEALRMHTLDSAATMGEEDQKGSITPGKLADMIALDRDPLTCDVDDLRSIKVEWVMNKGKQVFSRI